jgi:hypothetical protein
MKTKTISIQVEDCRDARTYDAVVVQAKKRGNDRVGEPIVSLQFKVYQRNGKATPLTKFYFGPFTKDSSLLRDLKRIAGPEVVESVFDLRLAVDKRCKVKVSPGESHPQLHVLGPEKPPR